MLGNMQDSNQPCLKKKIYIYGGMIGQGDGAHLASWLLCKELADMGNDVTCFAQHVYWGGPTPNLLFKIITPWITRGCRWDWPGRCITWQMKRMIRRERPDLVIALGVIKHVAYLLKSDVANQVMVWELTNATVGNKFVNEAARQLLGRCRAMLSPSETIDANIRNNYGYGGPIHRLPFWIEDWQKPCPETPKEFIADFIFLGRRDEEKGLRELIQATARLTNEFPQVKILIAGPGCADPYVSLARDLGVQNNVRFKFFKGRTEMLAALAASRALVLPSYHEGYPLVLLEAAQMGIPIVATAVGSIPEVYGASEAAILCNPRDTVALTYAMKSLLQDKYNDYARRRATAKSLFKNISSKDVIHKLLLHISN